MISVILPPFNCKNYIERSIDSILNQKMNTDDFKVILINDGSTDNSQLIIEKFVDNNLNFKCKYQENKGPGEARNIGLNLAIGEYVYFMDSDDFLSPYAFSKYIYIYLNYKEIGIFMFDYNLFRNNKDHIRFSKRNNLPSEIIFYGNSKEYIDKFGLTLSLWCCIIKKEIINNCNVWFPKLFYAEDWHFLLNLLQYPNLLILKTNDKIYNHILNSSGITYNKDNSHLLKLIDSLFKSCLYLLKLQNSLFFPDTLIAESLNNHNFDIIIKLMKGNFKFKQTKNYLIYFRKNKIIPLSINTPYYYKFINNITTNSFIF